MEIKEIATSSPATNFVTNTCIDQTQNPPEAFLENHPSNPSSSTSSSSKLIFGYPNINAYLESFPKGYRFKPTEEELIVHYLLKKLENGKLPPSRIHDADIYKESPVYLSENYEEANEGEWYFFSPREKKYRNGKRPNRAAGNGYWKASGADKSIKSSKNKKVEVGLVKTLVYYEGIHTNSRKTSWIMKEFKVRDSPLSNSSKQPMKLDDYLLYKIYEKKYKANVEDGEAANDQDHGPDGDFDVAHQTQNIHQDHGPDQQNIPEIDNSGGQQQRLMWRTPNPNFSTYNNPVLVNDMWMLIPDMPSNGFNHHDLMLHGTSYSNQPIVSHDMGYINFNPQEFSQAVQPVADAFNDVQALTNESIIPQQFSPATPPVADAFNNVHQAFNNGMNIPQMQPQQYQRLVMTRPSPYSLYHPYHHPDLPHN